MQPITIYITGEVWLGYDVNQVGQPEKLTELPDSVPNPAKVVIILEELGLPYVNKFVEFTELKSGPFLSINPNGRVPDALSTVLYSRDHGSKHWRHALVVCCYC